MATIRKREWTAANGDAKAAWQVDYRDAEGKRRSKQFARKRDADTWLVSTNWEVQQGVHTPDSGSITVAEASKLWIDACKSKGLESATVRSYESTSRLHIVPLLGGERLARLRKPGIEAFKDRLLESGRTKERVKRAINYLSLMLGEMERRGLVAQNIAAKVRVPISARHRTEVAIPDQDELKALLEAADDDFRPFLLTAILTGMRASELRGLLWTDVDFEAAIVHVRRRADELNKIGPPKSRAGRRSIPMSPRLVKELKAWKLRSKPNLLNLVFPSPEGHVWAYNNLMNRRFWRFW